MTIRINDFCNEFADKHQITKKDARLYVEGVFDLISEHLSNGDSVDLNSFAKFETKIRPPKVGRNPHTGEPIEIPACKVLKVTARQSLKERL